MTTPSSTSMTITALSDHIQQAQGSIPPQLTQTGYAERFIRRCADVCKFVPGLGWHIYDNGVWRLDELDDITYLTHVVEDALREEFISGELGDDLTDVRFSRVITDVAKKSTKTAILEIAAADPRMKVSAAQLNGDPWSLTVLNGRLNLRTGELHPASPADLATLQAGVAFDPAGTCPRFDELLEYAFPEDPEMIAYVWRVLGYALTGVKSEQEFYFLWGERYSAKSTINEVLVRLLGSYAQTLDENALTGSGREHPTWIADLLGKRVVYQDELDARQRLNTGRINRLTGSELPLRGRRMRKDFFPVTVQAKIFISTNHRPPLGNAQDGVWRRLRPWHFTRPWPVEKRVKDFSRVLVDEEGPGILNGCLRGLQDYLGLLSPHSGGLRTPAVVLAGAKDYQVSEDDLSPFFEDCLTRTDDPDDWLANEDIYTAYTRWCDENGVSKRDRLHGIHLSRNMCERGFTRHSTPLKAHRKVPGGVEKRLLRGFSNVKLVGESTAWGAISPWVRVTTPLN